MEPAFKKAVDRSLRDARDLGHNYLGSAHIVLALLQGKGIVAVKNWAVALRLHSHSNSAQVTDRCNSSIIDAPHFRCGSCR